MRKAWISIIIGLQAAFLIGALVFYAGPAYQSSGMPGAVTTLDVTRKLLVEGAAESKTFQGKAALLAAARDAAKAFEEGRTPKDAVELTWAPGNYIVQVDIPKGTTAIIVGKDVPAQPIAGIDAVQPNILQEAGMTGMFLGVLTAERPGQPQAGKASSAGEIRIGDFTFVVDRELLMALGNDAAAQAVRDFSARLLQIQRGAAIASAFRDFSERAVVVGVPGSEANLIVAPIIPRQQEGLGQIATLVYETEVGIQTPAALLTIPQVETLLAAPGLSSAQEQALTQYREQLAEEVAAAVRESIPSATALKPTPEAAQKLAYIRERFLSPERAKEPAIREMPMINITPSVISVPGIEGASLALVETEPLKLQAVYYEPADYGEAEKLALVEFSRAAVEKEILTTIAPASSEYRLWRHYAQQQEVREAAGYVTSGAFQIIGELASPMFNENLIYLESVESNARKLALLKQAFQEPRREISNRWLAEAYEVRFTPSAAVLPGLESTEMVLVETAPLRLEAMIYTPAAKGAELKSSLAELTEAAKEALLKTQTPGTPAYELYSHFAKPAVAEVSTAGFAVAEKASSAGEAYYQIGPADIKKITQLTAEEETIGTFDWDYMKYQQKFDVVKPAGVILAEAPKEMETAKARIEELLFEQVKPLSVQPGEMRAEEEMVQTAGEGREAVVVPVSAEEFIIMEQPAKAYAPVMAERAVAELIKSARVERGALLIDFNALGVKGKRKDGSDVFVPHDFVMKAISILNNLKDIQVDGKPRYHVAVYSNEYTVAQMTNLLGALAVPIADNFIQADTVEQAVTQIAAAEEIPVGNIVVTLAEATIERSPDVLRGLQEAVRLAMVQTPKPGYGSYKSILLKSLELLVGVIPQSEIRKLELDIENAAEIRGITIEPEKKEDKAVSRMQAAVSV